LFVALCCTASAIAPSLGIAVLAAAHDLPLRELFWNWWIWWQGDASGMLVIAPLVLSWSTRDTVTWTRRRALEGVVFWVFLLLASHLVFAAGSRVRSFSTTFVLVPLVVWAAFRFHQRGVTTATAAVCGMALWYTLVDRTGPFAPQALHEAVL